MNKQEPVTLNKIGDMRFDSGKNVLETAEEFSRLMAYYRSACMEIKTKFDVMNENFNLQLDRTPIVSISTRLKKPMSIKEKLERKGIPLTVKSVWENLNDVAGIRVVCSFLDDVYMLEKGLLSQDDIVLIEKKDYIKNPKENGYRSLHLIVEVPIFLCNEKKMMRAEIQLRTIAMECWATLEHQINYKKSGAADTEMEELRSCAELGTELDRRMGKLWHKMNKNREAEKALS